MSISNTSNSYQGSFRCAVYLFLSTCCPSFHKSVTKKCPENHVHKKFSHIWISKSRIMCTYHMSRFICMAYTAEYISIPVAVVELQTFSRRIEQTWVLHNFMTYLSFCSIHAFVDQNLWKQMQSFLRISDKLLINAKRYLDIKLACCPDFLRRQFAIQTQ